MSVFNSFTGSCENASTSNISEYYNTVGEYVKSTLPQYTSTDPNHQSGCVVTHNTKSNLCPEQSYNGNLKSQCRYINVSGYVPNYQFPATGQSVSQNKPYLYNVPFVHQNNSNSAMMYRHFFHTRKPSFKVNMKKKRRRTIFTTEQIIALEAVFQKKPYINREERVLMMRKLQVSEKSIKIWFQNRRRLTDKKDKDYVSDSSSDESSETINDRLTYIESQIQKNTDKCGFVTLDDKVMGELANIIDECLSEDVSRDVTTLYNNRTIVLRNGKNESILMYEPISPVSLLETLDI